MSRIEIKNLSVEYPLKNERIRVIDNLNLILKRNEISVVLGRSGCGKTTLLRMIKGIENPSGGSVNCNNLKVAYLFQEPRLLPWLNVRDNVAFGIGDRNKDANYEKIDSLIDLVGLSKFKNSYPRELSGGMQSRVALIRALAYEAEYILMDEPFAALDYFTRENLQKELLKIQSIEKFGILLVSHSIDEALILGDIIYVMDKGKLKTSYKMNFEKKDLLSDEIISIKRKIIGDLKE